MRRENKFALFHAKQGLVLFIFFVGGIVIGIIPFIGPLIYRIVIPLYLVALLWGTIQALMGKLSRLPIISSIADKIVL